MNTKFLLFLISLQHILATFKELLTPILLVLGFMTRLTTLPLLIMTAVIQFTYLNMEIHFYWASLLTSILLLGPGKISLDYILKKNFHLKLSA